MSGQTVDVKKNTYLTVLAAGAVPSFFDYEDGMDKITNPSTNISREFSYGGTVEFTALASMASPFAYVLDDTDYKAMTKGLSKEYREHMVFFNVSDIKNSYDFAKDLLHSISAPPVLFPITWATGTSGKKNRRKRRANPMATAAASI